MQRWVQPYGSSLQLDVTAGALALAAVALAAQLCGFAAQGPYPVATWIAVLAFDALFVLVVWRVVKVGLFINEHGIKVRMLLRTRIVPWTAIALVREGTASNYDARAIVLALRAPHRVIETPIWLKDGAPAHRNRVKLDAEEFHLLIDRLNAVVARFGG